MVVLFISSMCPAATSGRDYGVQSLHSPFSRTQDRWNTAECSYLMYNCLLYTSDAADE